MIKSCYLFKYKKPKSDFGFFVADNYAKASGYNVLAFIKTDLEIFDEAKKSIEPINKKPTKNIF